MPPKKSGDTAKEKLLDDEEEVLQAVVLADSFNKRFRPLTTQRPRCLLPVCNAPLLDWTFESLALAGVQEIFVVCRSHANQVQDTIRKSRWSQPGSGIKIVPIMTAKETFSPGDAMRDVYTRGLVTSDFVLVMGDLVSNVRIDEVVRVHKERRKTNKDAIMTMVVKESGVKHRTRSKGDSGVYVLDSETSECLHYVPVTGHNPEKDVPIPREILEGREVEIRNDFIDCSIDICSVEVPSLFQDNFDYADIRRDFVHGVLTSDLLMKNIYCYVEKEGYAARVQDTRSYDSVSKDIISRWTFPLVPDDNHPSGHIYSHLRGNRYLAKDNSVSLARTSKVGNNCMIGSNTRVADNSELSFSVLGRDVRIGSKTIVQDSYILDGAEIGNGCVIQRSIVGSGARIKDGSVLQRGCLIGDGVIVGPNAKLEAFERLSKRRSAEAQQKDEEDRDGDDDDDDSELEELEASQTSTPENLGKESNAIVWPREPPSEEDDEEGVESFRNQRYMRIGENESELETSDSEGEESETESESSEDEMMPGLASSTTSLSLTTGGDLDIPSSVAKAESEFQSEVFQSLERAFAEGHSVDNAAVELKTLRMASNVPLSRVREAVVAAIVDRIPIIAPGGSAAAQRGEIAKVISRWGELINKIGGVNKVETVFALQGHCASSDRLPLFGQVLAALYQDDIVEGDDIEAWFIKSGAKLKEMPPGEEQENMKRCWDVGGLMLKQISEAESSDEEDSSEEE